jgi:BCD family chlorophyll transporter-like MFS transporter
MPIVKLLRLGLRQFAAGMLSVLALGILNRVMKVEMGLDLGLVSTLIAIHYFAAPLAIPFGHRSDRKPYFGLHRTPYIFAGTGLTVIATIAAPFSALHLESHQGSAVAVALVAFVFLLLGLGIYTAGTAYLSLIVDLTPEQERGKAVAIVWSMMMIGILVGVFLGIGILDQYTPTRLVTLFLIMSAIVAFFTVIAVIGMEQRRTSTPSIEGITNRQAIGLMFSGKQTRLFFGFLLSGILFLFLQNVVLEPFGGDVLRLDVQATTRFNAYQMVGVLSGMGLAGMWLTRRFSNRTIASFGLVFASFSFTGLGLISITANPTWINPAILTMGFGMGLFNVGALAIMMGMSVDGRTGLYMGAWTLSQAIANGFASTGGGLVHDLALVVSGTEPLAYATVFFLEALGLIGTYLLLQRLSIQQFRQETLQTSVIFAQSS